MTRPGPALAVLAALAALAIAGAACDRRPPIASCDDDLRGVYDGGGGSWMILDGPAGLDAYPLFPDVPAAPGLEIAPRVIALTRTPAGITGNVRRRYMRGSQVCVAKVPVRVTACRGETLELVLADPEPPLAWPEEPEHADRTGAACTWPRPGDSRVERWIRR
jgi:hypothetical protein